MKRSTFLTVWLVVLTILTVLGVLGSVVALGGASLLGATLTNFPSWYLPVSLVVSVIELGGVVLFWKWKMLGFQLLTAGAVVSVVVGYLTSGTSSLVGSLLSIALVVVLYFAMKPVWGSFK